MQPLTPHNHRMLPSSALWICMIRYTQLTDITTTSLNFRRRNTTKTNTQNRMKIYLFKYINFTLNCFQIHDKIVLINFKK